MNTLTEIQKAYIAGAIDGEGHIGIGKSKDIPIDSFDYNYSPEINISNTNIDFLKYIKKITNIGSINKIHNKTNKREDCLDWSLIVNEMSRFLNTILPYLIIKNNQAKLIIEFRETYKIDYNRWNPTPSDIISTRACIYEEMLEYNKKGPTNIYYKYNPKILTTNHIKGLNILTETQKAYIAGALDGEGLIGVGRPKTKLPNHNDWLYTTNIRIINTNINLLNYIITTTNIGIIELHSNETENHKKRWRWRLIKDEIIPFLNTIEPYLIIKKKHVPLMKEFIDTYKIKHNRYHPASNDIGILRELIFEDFTVLNRRGPSSTKPQW